MDSSDRPISESAPIEPGAGPTAPTDHPAPVGDAPALPRPDHPVPVAPPVSDGVFRQLDPRFVSAERVGGWIVLGVFAVGTIITLAILALSRGWTMAAVGWIAVAWCSLFCVWALLAHVHPVWVHRRTSYSVSPRGIEIRRGIIWRFVINVPRSRVQHTDVAQGPLQRHYRLASLVIHTAGTANASVTLAGLSEETAYAIRDFLIGRRDDDGT